MNTKMAGAFALAVAALVCFIDPRVSAASTLINIDFGTIMGTPFSNYGAASGQVGYWNGISNSGSTDLKDLSGSLLPGAAVTVSTSGLTMGGFIGGPGYAYSANDSALIQDNFYTSGAAWSVGLTGLDNGNYDLYVYGPRNYLVSTSSFLVNGVAQTDLSTPPYSGSSPLVEGIDYEIVKLLISNHTIDIASGADEGYFSGLAGLQLVQATAVAATPLPNTAILFVSALGVLGLVTWRKKRSQALAG